MRKLTGPKGMVVVLLNSDEYLRRKKGEHRPVQCLEHRIQVLRAMRNVDIVVPFHDDDPCRLIRIMQPDIWVKGIEYRDKGIPEEAAMAAVGGTVTYVDTGVVAHTSTILSKIERQYDEKR
jgi:rfaE bifunctional protein nucleotidyltransferase chain/domain